jgi:dimethylhistidine N-methyltransferase
MASVAKTQLSPFAFDVAEGLAHSRQKKLPPRWFYDGMGSALFEAITMLPEYGLTRADERLLRVHSADLAAIVSPISLAVELGSGSGRKTRYILQSLARGGDGLLYRPIDVSPDALASCEKQLSDLAEVRPVTADWLEGLQTIVRSREARHPLILLFLGSSIGNISRQSIPAFLNKIRELLQPGDFFLLGADLLKDPAIMLAAYDDALGVTASFNLNVLRRINDELGADFDLRAFTHQARWDPVERRIEMHLLCRRDCNVRIEALETNFTFRAGETIWTESSYKFTSAELDAYAADAGFSPVETWVDSEWPFAETLWTASNSHPEFRA